MRVSDVPSPTQDATIRLTRVARRAFPMKQVSRALERSYGSPRHGNKRNPLDELIYIILSTRTRQQSFGAIFKKLKKTFPKWDSVTPARLRRLESVLEPGGLGRLKARQILGIIERLRSLYDRATLAPLRTMCDKEAEEFLTSLPGVGVKIAKCVLMYSQDRAVLPVDVHVHRLATRLGLRTKKRPDTSQDLIESAVPAEQRYGFHVNAIAHGRAVCLPRIPKCEVCCLSRWCEYFNASRLS
jgi:endonuclease III